MNLQREENRCLMFLVVLCRGKKHVMVVAVVVVVVVGERGLYNAQGGFKRGIEKKTFPGLVAITLNGMCTQ